MSALSTPGGGGTTAQNKPASGKQKYQKLDINSLYFAQKNENSEPSSIKSQLSRKHGMQSLGKVPSARRPPANLPSLKTETGQDTSAISTIVTTTVPTQPICTTQTIATTSNINVVAGTGPGGWVALPPPSSPHFRTEFPSLEAAAQPSHRSTDHSTPQPQLRPQTEGSWTSGGTAGVRQESVPTIVTPVVTTPATQQIPALRTIMPSFLVKGSSGGGLGLGAMGTQREGRSSGSGSSHTSALTQPRPAHRPPATPRAVEVLTARPILRDDQISSLDDISRDAGWAQHDDIDYDQKLDFSDGESSAPTKGSSKSGLRTSIETDRLDTKIHEPGDEEQLWAERRQRQNNEVAQAVARARQRKEEEQRRQMREIPMQSQHPKELRDRAERDRNENRERDLDQKERIETRDRDRAERERERIESREKDRNDVRDRGTRDKERNDPREREMREKERVENRERERINNRDRFDNRDRDRERDHDRERDRIDNREKARVENRDRGESDKERIEVREKDHNENRDRDRFERERDRDRDRGDRDRNDRDFRERDREYGRDRDQNNPAFSKTFQANIPPRFLKQQQNRQDDHKGWAFSGKPAPRRQEPPTYNAPRHTPHNGRRSYSRDYSDREDDFRRDGSGPQWRSEMQDYDRPRELDRSNSKDSYKELGDNKDRRNEADKKKNESTIEPSSISAAEKLSEVFERKSIGVTESVSSDASVQIIPPRKNTPTLNNSQRESSEREFAKASWAEVTQEDLRSSSVLKTPTENPAQLKDIESQTKEALKIKSDEIKCSSQPKVTASSTTSPNMSTPLVSQNLPSMSDNENSIIQNLGLNQQSSPLPNNNLLTNQPQIIAVLNRPTSNEYSISKHIPSSVPKVDNQIETLATPSQPLKLPSEQKSHQNIIKPVFTLSTSDNKLPEVESIEALVSTDPVNVIKVSETQPKESLHGGTDLQKRSVDVKGNDNFSNEHLNKISSKDPIERKSSGSGSEKRSRGYGGGGGSGYAVYNRGWGQRESRGRRSHRNSRSNNRASESDASTDGAPNSDRKERRRAPRSPRGSKKLEKSDSNNQPTPQDQTVVISDGLENREPFAPRGQPSRRGRGGFQGSSRPPAPAKRVTGYGPPNTKSPFSHANRAVKENEEVKENIQSDDKGKASNKSRAGSSTGRGRDRRPKGVTGPLSGEDENWETTSEHSEGGTTAGRRRSVPTGQSGQVQKNQGGRNQNVTNRQNNGRNTQGVKKENVEKGNDVVEANNDLKVNNVKKDEESVDDGFQEVRNKKNSKDTRVPIKEENQHAPAKQPRSHSNQGGGRNGSSSRNSNDKSNSRNNVPIAGKSGTQYERPRQANLAPRFMKQRQKQQIGLVTGFGPDTGAAPPPPAVNAWDKPISQTLRGNVEEPVEAVENKSTQSSQRSTPAEAPTESKTAPPPTALVTDKSGVLDGTTPPVETIIFENTNYKTSPPEETLQQKYPLGASISKPDEISTEMESRSIAFNGDVRTRPRSIQELIGDNNRSASEGDPSLGLQMSFDTSQKTEDSSDMKLDFAFDQLTDDKTAKSLGLPRGVHMSTSNTISPLAADLNLKIASVKKVWEMSAVAEGSEELQFSGFEEPNTESAPPNVCKVKPTQQLQSPPPQHYNHVGYQGSYGGLSVPSPPAVLFNSSQQLLGSSQQLPQQGGLYGAFQIDQSRGQFGGFPGTPYGASSAAPYNYHQTPPDMFQNLPSQYRMAAAGGGAAFGQSGQLGNNPNTVLIPSTSNSLISATVKPSTQQIGAIGSKGGGVAGVGGVGGVNTYQQQYLGYSAPVGEAQYSLQGLLPRPAPPASSYYSPYQPQAAPAPTYPLQFTQPAQSGAFGSQFLSSQLQVAAAVQQMQQQYRAPLQQQYPPPQPQPRPPPQQQLKSPLHEHANGFAPLCESASPTPKGGPKPQKPPHSPPQHKYHAPPPHPPPPHPPPSHTPHQHHQQQQMMSGGNNGRCSGGGGGGGMGGNAMARAGLAAPRYPAPIQRPHAPALPLFRTPPGPQQRPHHAQPRPNLYYHHHQRNGGGGGERAPDGGETGAGAEEGIDPPPSQDAPPAPTAELKAE